MTKVTFHRGLPVIDRESFLTPFDKMFDDIVSTSFPQINEQVGVTPFSNSAYPKVNVYEYDDKVGLIAEIPVLYTKDLNVEVDDGTVLGSGEFLPEGEDLSKERLMFLFLEVDIPVKQVYTHNEIQKFVENVPVLQRRVVYHSTQIVR